MQNLKMQNYENAWHTIQNTTFNSTQIDFAVLKIVNLQVCDFQARWLARRNSQSGKLATCWLKSRNSLAYSNMIDSQRASS